jgi:hypothetical protein
MFSELKNEPFFPTLIVSSPVYEHTAFLDDFFWRSFPYTQAEATPVLRTRGESSPLSPRDRSCVLKTHMLHQTCARPSSCVNEVTKR